MKWPSENPFAKRPLKDWAILTASIGLSFWAGLAWERSSREERFLDLLETGLTQRPSALGDRPAPDVGVEPMSDNQTPLTENHNGGPVAALSGDDRQALQPRQDRILPPSTFEQRVRDFDRRFEEGQRDFSRRWNEQAAAFDRSFGRFSSTPASTQGRQTAADEAQKPMKGPAKGTSGDDVTANSSTDEGAQ